MYVKSAHSVPGGMVTGVVALLLLGAIVGCDRDAYFQSLTDPARVGERVRWRGTFNTYAGLVVHHGEKVYRVSLLNHEGERLKHNRSYYVTGQIEYVAPAVEQFGLYPATNFVSGHTIVLTDLDVTPTTAPPERAASYQAVTVAHVLASATLFGASIAALQLRRRGPAQTVPVAGTSFLISPVVMGVFAAVVALSGAGLLYLGWPPLVSPVWRAVLVTKAACLALPVVLCILLRRQVKRHGNEALSSAKARVLTGGIALCLGTAMTLGVLSRVT